MAVVPGSLFHFSRPMPEVYTVSLFDLEELSSPAPEPAPKPEPEPEPAASKEAVEQESVAPPTEATSMEPLLSTRPIPQAPTEIKLLRPRAVKKDLRQSDQQKDGPLPPLDSSMMLAALQRIEQQEKAAAAEKRAAAAQKEAEAAAEKAVESLRKSILTRQTAGATASQEAATGGAPGTTTAGSKGRSGYSGPPGSGQAATTALKQYKALVAQHIGRFWILPEGQVWTRELRATVLIKVRLDGIVTATTLETSSGSGQFDKFVLQTIKEASPLPPFPQEIPHLPLRLHFYPEGMR